MGDLRGSANWALNLVDGHRVLPMLLSDLVAARASIHVTTFLWFNDPIGQQLAQVLGERAQAGVDVRVIIDAHKTKIGDPFSTGEQQMMEEDPQFPQDAMDVDGLVQRMRQDGIRVLNSNMDFDRPVDELAEELREQRRLILETSRVDTLHVDHRKVITIDGSVGYCGSANVGAQYLHWWAFVPELKAKEEADRLRRIGADEPWWKWHDGLARFEGPIVKALDGAFRERWALGGGDDYVECDVVPTGRPPQGFEVDAIELFKNQPDDTPNACRLAFLESIAAARESIFIENPYVYHPDIIRALIAARQARPQLRVDLIVPALRWNDNAYSQDAMQHHYRALLTAGVRIFEYQNHFTHLKVATFDGRISIVGSANLNFRSLEDDCDFELILRVHGAAFAQSIERSVRDADVPRSVEMTQDDLTFRIRRRDPRTLFLVGRRVL